jgi:hypothetical protein
MVVSVPEFQCRFEVSSGPLEPRNQRISPLQSLVRSFSVLPTVERNKGKPATLKGLFVFRQIDPINGPGNKLKITKMSLFTFDVKKKNPKGEKRS